MKDALKQELLGYLYLNDPVPLHETIQTVARYANVLRLWVLATYFELSEMGYVITEVRDGTPQLILTRKGLKELTAGGHGYMDMTAQTTVAR
jgi:hypothetical protein